MASATQTTTTSETTPTSTGPSVVATYNFIVGQTGATYGYVSTRFGNNGGTLINFTSSEFSLTDAIYTTSTSTNSVINTYVTGTYTLADVQDYVMICDAWPNTVFATSFVSDNDYISFSNTGTIENSFVNGNTVECLMYDGNPT